MVSWFWMEIWKAAAPVVLRKFQADCHEILRDTSADLQDLLFAVIFTKKTCKLRSWG